MAVRKIIVKIHATIFFVGHYCVQLPIIILFGVFLIDLCWWQVMVIVSGLSKFVACSEYNINSSCAIFTRHLIQSIHQGTLLLLSFLKNLFSHERCKTVGRKTAKQNTKWREEKSRLSPLLFEFFPWRRLRFLQVIFSPLDIKADGRRRKWGRFNFAAFDNFYLRSKKL